MTDWIDAATLAAATLASEDLTAIGAATLAAHGHVQVSTAIAAVASGIYLGDLLLFAGGRVARHTGRNAPWFRRWAQRAELRAIGRHVDQRLGCIVIGSRFLPGSRLPLYIAAGLFSRRPLAFCLWSLLAVCLWTPLLMCAVIAAGSVVEAPLHSFLGWAPAVGVLLALRYLSRLTPGGASRVHS